MNTIFVIVISVSFIAALFLSFYIGRLLGREDSEKKHLNQQINATIQSMKKTSKKRHKYTKSEDAMIVNAIVENNGNVPKKVKQKLAKTIGVSESAINSRIWGFKNS